MSASVMVCPCVWFLQAPVTTPGLPNGWEQRASPDGRTYYVVRTFTEFFVEVLMVTGRLSSNKVLPMVPLGTDSDGLFGRTTTPRPPIGSGLRCRRGPRPISLRVMRMIDAVVEQDVGLSAAHRWRIHVN
jgi:hypothetical protein